jgi:ATP-dependent RNA helicase DeaD
MARVEAGQQHITPIKEVEEFRPREPRRAAPQREMAGGGRRRRGENEEGMVRLTLSAGRAHGIRPNDVVGSIAFHADIPGYSIGAIRIQEQHTLFDVPEQFVAQVLAKAGSYRIRKHSVAIERAR